MNKERDEALRSKMNNALAEDLFPDFDEDQVWKRIETAVAPKPAKRKALVWLPVAAALLVGLLIGFSMKKETHSIQVKAKTAEAQMVIRDTVYQTSAPIVQTVTAETKNKKTVVAQQQTPANNPVAQREEVFPSETQVEKQTEKSEESITVKAAPAAPEVTPLAVVYFDELKAGKNAAADKMLVKRKRRKLIELKRPEEGESTLQELPIRNLFFALNK